MLNENIFNHISYKRNCKEMNLLEHNGNLKFSNNKPNLERDLKAFHVSEQIELNNVYKTDTKIPILETFNNKSHISSGINQSLIG